MKNVDVVNLLRIVRSITQQTLSYNLARKMLGIQQVLEDEVNVLIKIIDGCELGTTYKNYREELETLTISYAQKDGLGNVCHSQGQPIIRQEDLNEYGLKVQELILKYSDVENTYRLRTANILNESTMLDIKITKEDLKEVKVQPNDLELLKLIEE